MSFRYSTPAGHNDLVGKPNEQAYLDAWSALIGEQFHGQVQALQRTLRQAPLFFSELDVVVPTGTATKPVPWVGFPRPLMLRFNGDRRQALAEAEIRGTRVLGFLEEELNTPVLAGFRQQDEYLEWVPLKENGKLVGFAFTAEGPEYWEHLAAFDKSAVQELYETFTGRSVAWSELSFAHDVWAKAPDGGAQIIYHAGDYNPYNTVNLEECAAHLTHPANTLGAEIDLAAKATVQRKDAAGHALSERRRLACCSNFGDPNRNSDPGIGLAVNLTVRGGVSLTLADPVGLYILSFNEGLVADKDGDSLDDWWVVTRGVEGRGLRAEFRPPAGALNTIADVRVAGDEPLTTGGQLAELTTMVLYATALALGVDEPSALACVAHCCVEKGSPPEATMLAHVAAGQSCPAGSSDAFPELTRPPMTPFSRRTLGAASALRGTGEVA